MGLLQAQHQGMEHTCLHKHNSSWVWGVATVPLTHTVHRQRVVERCLLVVYKLDSLMMGMFPTSHLGSQLC